MSSKTGRVSDVEKVKQQQAEALQKKALERAQQILAGKSPAVATTPARGRAESDTTDPKSVGSGRRRSGTRKTVQEAREEAMAALVARQEEALRNFQKNVTPGKKSPAATVLSTSKRPSVIEKAVSPAQAAVIVEDAEEEVLQAETKQRRRPKSTTGRKVNEQVTEEEEKAESKKRKEEKKRKLAERAAADIKRKASPVRSIFLSLAVFIGSLAAWIVIDQSLRVGAFSPEIQEIDGIISYLEKLQGSDRMTAQQIESSYTDTSSNLVISHASKEQNMALATLTDSFRGIAAKETVMGVLREKVESGSLDHRKAVELASDQGLAAFVAVRRSFGSALAPIAYRLANSWQVILCVAATGFFFSFLLE